VSCQSAAHGTAGVKKTTQIDVPVCAELIQAASYDNMLCILNAAAQRDVRIKGLAKSSAELPRRLDPERAAMGDDGPETLALGYLLLEIHSLLQSLLQSKSLSAGFAVGHDSDDRLAPYIGSVSLAFNASIQPESLGQTGRLDLKLQTRKPAPQLELLPATPGSGVSGEKGPMGGDCDDRLHGLLAGR